MVESVPPPFIIRQRFDNATLQAYWTEHDNHWTLEGNASVHDEFFAIHRLDRGRTAPEVGAVLLRPVCNPLADTQAQPTFEPAMFSLSERLKLEQTHSFYCWSDGCTKDMMRACMATARCLKAAIASRDMPVRLVEESLGYQTTCLGAKVDLRADVELCIRIIAEQRCARQTRNIEPELAYKIWSMRHRLLRYYHIDEVASTH